MNKWRKNIIITFIIRICLTLIFTVSVISLFWKSHGMSLADIFLLQAIFAVSIVICEIPTGYIGDRLGRKKTLICASVIVGVGWLFYSVSQNFWQFVIAEVTLGCGFSFLSGTDTSLIFESLKELGDESSFVRIEGKQIGIKLGAEAAAALSGGFLAVALPVNILMLFSTGTALISLAACLFITDPPRNNYSHPRGTLYGLYKISRYIFLKSKVVRHVLPFMAACSLSTMLGVWLYPPLWEERGVPVWLFGILWAGMALPASLASTFAHRLEKLVGKKMILWLLPLPAVAGYFLIAFIPGLAALPFIYLVTITRGLNFPILSRYIHEETFSDKRATVLSVQNWLFRLGYFAFGPLVGLIGERSGLSWAYIACGVIAFVTTIVFLPALSRKIGNMSVPGAAEKTDETGQ